MIPPIRRPAPNDEKIGEQLYWLRLVRTTGGVEIGWDGNQMPPYVARALTEAGLARIDASDRPRMVRPKNA